MVGGGGMLSAPGASGATPGADLLLAGERQAAAAAAGEM